MHRIPNIFLLLGSLVTPLSCSECSSSGAVRSPSTRELTLAGTPQNFAEVGARYEFRPSITTLSTAPHVTFAIANGPKWASFDVRTGALTGSPTARDVGTSSNIRISVVEAGAAVALRAFSITVTDGSARHDSAPARSAEGAPLVLYTDIVSGPSEGGEDDQGAYLSIFGKHFGSAGLGSRVKVFVGNSEVRNYRYLGASRGREDIAQISVQLGALGHQSVGTKLPIRVVVDGVASNTDHTFTINPGRILFVDNVVGNDATARIGDIKRPFRHVQTSDLKQGAWGQARPGDFIVMRGTGREWTDVGFEHYFMRYRDKSGNAPTGAPGTGPIVLMGYPKEDVRIHGTLANGVSGGCISAVNGETFAGMGQWAVISNLRIDCEGYDGPVSQEILGNHWRVVNNDLSAANAPTSGPNVPRMGGIVGNGLDSVWLGNHIHDIQGSAGECHGIYVDGDGSYEIAYNHIENIRSGNGLQIYANGGNGSVVANNVDFHHNRVHDVSKHGLNVADGSKAGISIYNNVVYNTQIGGIRFNTRDLKGARIFNNTFYAANMRGNASYGVVMNDWALPPGAASFKNNIFVPFSKTPYLGGTMDIVSVLNEASDHNLFYGGRGPTLGAAPVTGDPLFINATAGDFHLASGSPAIGAGAEVDSALGTDFDAKRRSGRHEVGAFAH